MPHTVLARVRPGTAQHSRGEGAVRSSAVNTRVYEKTCVCARARVCVRARARARVCVHARALLCVCARWCRIIPRFGTTGDYLYTTRRRRTPVPLCARSADSRYLQAAGRCARVRAAGAGGAAVAVSRVLVVQRWGCEDIEGRSGVQVRCAKVCDVRHLLGTLLGAPAD